MKKILSIIAITFLLSNVMIAQKLITKDGVIDIHSETAIFTIKAKNQKVASILDTETGEVVASTLVRSFKFHEALVEEHFNENYMESHKFPKSQFNGKIDNLATINFSKDGVYPVKFSGELTMHGETNKINSEGTITISGSNVNGRTTFYISLAAYKIKVEESYKDRINDQIKLELDFNYQPIKK